MGNWPDAKIRSTAIWYIGKHAMDLPAWRYTLVGEAHSEVLSHAKLEPGELSLVSFLATETNWYLLTTRRVIGALFERRVRVAALDILEDRFGNFKGFGGLSF